ncbi:ABC transporter ATP-binding protein [Methylococcus sp. EFPC2]|uniref:ABC transporter ATP-binding protein n=1 Tax=Methylococcus sp. EFPC2 TaxID=2812648 RepID=UPI001966CE5E|nr:ABC transporter ATP-binding protein [Methylococcus sp. EFPC2]QSA95689.1 ABC transporter ATP-binding protein [Methylococcus sp. EFPC2]
MEVVRVFHASKSYLLGKQRVDALVDVSLSIEAGEFLAIAGPSGSGKSTLLNLIGCIDKASSGQIFIGGMEVSRCGANQLADIRLHTIGFIFQTFNLLPVLSAWENVEYPLLFRKDMSRKLRSERVKYYLDMVGLSVYAGHRPNELSGGQRQRVAIARALAGNPRIVLADEPTANLDSKTGQEVLELMKQINEAEQTTFIFSTHDPRVMGMAHRIVKISDGRLVASDQAADTIRGIYSPFLGDVEH